MRSLLAQLGQRFARHRFRSRGSQPAPDWRVIIRGRIVVAAAFLGIWALGIEARLVHLQIFEHADLEARAARQSERTQPVPAVRADILDRRGHVLATSVDVDTLAADPSEIVWPAETVERLCAALGDCTKEERRRILERFRGKGEFTYLRRRIRPDQAQRIADLDLTGILGGRESRRFYPNNDLAAQVLGFVGTDNRGLGGIEWAYDRWIRGQDGEIVRVKDGVGRAFRRSERPATAGATLELTIDEQLQHVVERELGAAVREHRADSGSAVVMEPKTGNILAMASVPTFDPNEFNDAVEGAHRNRAVQDLYEPGSTFKIVTASAAIEDKVLPITTMIDTSPGVLRVGNSKPITEYEHHNYGLLSFTDVIVRSSNVGAAKIGLRVGADRLIHFASLYGFGGRVSPDFPGESPGILWEPARLNDSALARVAMGYQVSVTPLQVAAAFSAVANGGLYVEPRVVRALYKDNRRVAVKPKTLRRVISADTAATLISIMEEVVERGTAKNAQVAGYTIAGKTGTASRLIDGRYAATENNVSFAGFLPSRDPAVTVVILLNSPRAGGRAGGVVAAPVFQRIAQAAVQYLGIVPSINPDPPVLVARSGDVPTEPTVAVVEPPAIQRVAISTPPGTVPDLQGMSGRDASRRLASLGIVARLTGDGFVVAQDPAAGTPIEPGMRCRVVLARTVAANTVGGAQP